MFTQKLSMDCTREQYETQLRDELLKMGYVEKDMYWGRGILVFTNAADGVTGNMLDIDWEDKEKFGRTYIGAFNAPLFLALAAMTDKAEGNYGEYVTGVITSRLYKMNSEDKILPHHHLIYKATKEEIMQKFGKTETDTNYDAKEQLDAISLLKSKGYKILKPKINVSIYQKLSEDFIREFKDKVDWFYISKYQKLSEDFIKEFQDKVNWFYISAFQKLSEDFIREFQDKVSWYNVSIYQKLSEDFIREFKDRVDWYGITAHQKLSEDFIKEFKLKIDRDNWLYKSTEFKKQQVLNSNLYECYGDYFVAYKGIRLNRYSKFNFQYQYLVGNIYESHADFTNDENSFGLSVWTEERAKEYCSELIIKVKVKYEDVARLVHDNGKIRVTKFEVLT